MDNILVLRASSAGNLTGDATLTDMDLTPMNEVMYLHINVPSVTSGDTIAVTASFDDVSDNTLQTTTIPLISAAGHYVCPLFCDHPSLTDLSVLLDCTADSTAAMSFGAVEVWVSTSRKS